MARYTGPKSKIARKFGEPIYGPDKALERRNYPSGQHGLARRRKKISEYGVQLKKQNVPEVLPVKFCCSCWSAVWITLCIVWVLLRHVQLPVSWFLTVTLL